MKTRLITLMLIAVFSFPVFAQSNWYVQNSNSNRELTDVSFIDENTGWISGWTGTILKTTDGGQTWNALPNVPPNNAYYSVDFTDAQNGWASAYSGKIIHTTDGGQTWVNQSSPTNYDLYSLFFINATTGWAAGGLYDLYIDDRIILNTTDGGYTWTVQHGQAYKQPLKSIFFLDENNGYATGSDGVIMYTTNGGNVWVEQQVNSSFPFSDIFFTSTSTGFVVGEYLGLPHYSAIFRSSDGGISWNETSLGTDEILTSVYFTDELNGWAVGNDWGNGNTAIIYHTTDGGNNWLNQNIPSDDALAKVFFVDGTKGWAVGHLGTILAYDSQVPVELTSFTADIDDNNVVLNWQTATEKNNSGFEIQRSQKSENPNWQELGFVEGHGTTTEGNSYSFTDKNLEPGSYSYRLVQIDLGGTRNESEIVNVEISSQPKEYSLLQNYPNPFNPSTTIEFSIPESGNIKLEVYNSIGEEVSTLINNFEAAGSHKINFDAAGLPSGLYFYKLSAGNFSEVKKMILLK